MGAATVANTAKADETGSAVATASLNFQVKLLQCKEVLYLVQLQLLNQLLNLQQNQQSASTSASTSTSVSVSVSESASLSEQGSAELSAALSESAVATASEATSETTTTVSKSEDKVVLEQNSSEAALLNKIAGDYSATVSSSRKESST